MPLSALIQRFQRLWNHDIWTAGLTKERTIRNRGLALMRIVSITLSGLNELKVASRAAALSYSSLLGLGPLVAIAVLISGFALGDKDPALAANSLNKIISFIAPQVDQYQRALSDDQKLAAAKNRTTPSISVAAPTPSTAEVMPPPDPELVKLINNFITSSRSGAAGVVGILALLVIVVLLFTNIENTFNDIWGVRRGRSWMARVVYYWTVITLGALLFFASLTLFSAGAFVNVFSSSKPAETSQSVENKSADGISSNKEITASSAQRPLNKTFSKFLAFILPSSGAAALVLILTLFYRLIPNTRVKWRAAFVGAVLVTLLLFLNNFLAFLYFKNVVSTKSLYGSVGILPILMLGLYVFWFFVLVGGQITYAVQNVHYRSSQSAWHNLNHHTRESMSLLVLLLIARRFKACAPAYSVTQLSHHIRVPSQILNESLNRLCDLELIAELPPGEGADPSDHRYQPARPLGRITLADFREMFENYGESPAGGLLDNVDPILAHYHGRLTAALPIALGTQTLDELIDGLEPSQTYAPFPVR
ncbi:YihY/virulence factor BrkB family protein [Oleiharenicola lentus]|uniref:YihY/virulence factor BrkB family protein n=1 Tax=Oleiharenicola lentus TaxID=2508720 RepID=UPI003F679A77